MTRFAALLAFAIVGVFCMGTGVHGNGDRVCIYGIVHRTVCSRPARCTPSSCPPLWLVGLIGSG